MQVFDSSGCSVVLRVEMDFIALDADAQRAELVTGTGAGDAFAGVDQKPGIVGRALDQCLVQVKKLVFLPLQAGTGVRAIVVISKKLAVLVYDKDRLCFALDFDIKTFAAGVFDIAGFAEKVAHDVW